MGEVAAVTVESLVSRMSWPGAMVILGLLASVVLLAWPAHVPLEGIAAFVGSLGVLYVGWQTSLSRKDQAQTLTQVNGNNDALRLQAETAWRMVAQVKEEKAAAIEQYGRYMTQLAALAPSGVQLPPAITAPPEPTPPIPEPVSSPPVPVHAP